MTTRLRLEERPEEPDFRPEFDAISVLHGVPDELYEFDDVGSGGAADIHDEVRVYVGYHRAANHTTLHTDRFDETARRVALWVDEHTSRAGHTERLRALASAQARLHRPTDARFVT